MTYASIGQLVAVPASRGDVAQLARRWALVLAFAGIVLLAFDRGLYLRQWLYLNPTSYYARFRADIFNGWRQGLAIFDQAGSFNGDKQPSRDPHTVPLSTLLQAYRQRYADVVDGGKLGGIFPLDYPPGRLLIITLWAWCVRAQVPANVDPSDYGIAWPLLATNATLELAGAVAAFLLARQILRRQNIHGAEFIALLPALLLWFDPAMLLDAHIWPQWDVWLVPFYLLACYFGVTRKWLAVGVCITLGGMLKGQMLITMGLFVLWPMFQWRWRAVLEVVAGTVASTMLLMSPWMIRSWLAFFTLAALVVLLIAALPGIRHGSRLLFLVAGFGLAVLHIGLYMNGDLSWWVQGFAYGAHAHPGMNMGPTPNLAALMGTRYGWNLQDTIFNLSLPWLGVNQPIQTREFLGLLFGLSLVLCAIGAARHDARNDRRLLIALATPWVTMFTLLPQMHDRYLVWGAGITALCAAVSLGSTLLHLVITFLACLPIATNLFGHLPGSQAAPETIEAWQPWLRFLQVSYPDASWATLLACAALLYLSLAPSPRWRRASAASATNPNIAGSGTGVRT